MLPVFPTAYFGSIAYYQQLFRFEAVAIEQWDTFPKQTFRNRCTIPTANGIQRLTVPVEKPNGSKSLTKEIRISEQQDWRKIQWRTLFSAYGSAPYFEHYAQDIEQLLFSPIPDLLSFNMQISSMIAQLFDTEIRFVPTEDYIPVMDQKEDFRSYPFDSTDAPGFRNMQYTQVYFGQTAFYANMSILDLLFCEGPMGRKKIIF